jgi:hypothetical protein
LRDLGIEAEWQLITGDGAFFTVAAGGQIIFT